MAPNENELDKQLQRLLNRIRIVPPLDPRLVSQERAKFLAQGEKYRSTVSLSENPRHKGWINTFSFAFQRKERVPMLNTLMAIVVTLGLLFGGAGATVYASQGSLPDEPLYSVKTWSENARISLAGTDQEKLELTLGFINRRMAEIIGLQVAGRPVSEGVAVRLQEELDLALRIAANMDDPQMVQALEQIRSQAQIQSRAMSDLISDVDGQVDSILNRIQERLQDQVRMAASGEADPQGFRIQVRDRDQLSRPSQTPKQYQSGPASHTPSVTPDPTGDSYGPGPGGAQTTETPGHYGPGEPNPSQTPVPTGDSYGPGPGAGHPTSTPGGYGPGPQAGTSTFTPVQDGSGPGPGPNPSQTPQSGGSNSGQPSETQQPRGTGYGQGSATPQPGGNTGGGQP